MTLRAPRADTVRAFWHAMNERFDAHVVAKRSAAEMRVVSWALARMGVADQREFLERFATTVGHRVYLPFTPGEAEPGWDLWHQITVCAHEHQHVAQFDREGRVRFSRRYLRNSAARAQYEADAHTADMELLFWRFGKLPPIDDILEGLEHYSVDARDIAAARKTLEVNAKTVQRGGVITEAGRAAIDWLNAYAHYLREPKQA